MGGRDQGGDMNGKEEEGTSERGIRPSELGEGSRIEIPG